MIEKALKDESFRQQLLDNPKETIEKEFDYKIPESVQIQVLEENANNFYLILPGKNQQPEVELTESELNTVSGGTIVWSVMHCKELQGAG